MNRELIGKIGLHLAMVEAQTRFFGSPGPKYSKHSIELLKDYKAALSQEAEPVAWIDLSKMTPSGMVYATGFKANDRQTALYASPPKPAPLPQPVASVPQDVEEFICEKSNSYVLSHDLRDWMAGHARVSVEPTQKMLNAAEKVDWSNEDTRGSIINMWQAMIAASQQDCV